MMYSYHTKNNLVGVSQQGKSNIRQAFVSIFIFWSLVYLLVPEDGSQGLTLITTYIAAFLALLFLLFRMQRKGIISTNLALVGLIIFSIKVAIGIGHYLFFMDSGYFFSNSPEYSYFPDYEWLNRKMLEIAEHWSDFGFGTFPRGFVILEQKNVALLPYFSLLYYLGGNEHFLNISVVNSFHNILVAAVLANFAASMASKKVVAAVFIICLMQPFGLFSSILWRDSVGQFFLVAGAIIIAQSSGKLIETGKLVFAVILMGLLRNIYVLVGVLSLVGRQIQALLVKRAISRFQIALLTSFSFVAFYYSLPFISSFYDFSGNKGFELTYMRDTGALVKGVLIGLIGPFPWTQIFDSATNGREYLPQEILQAVFNLTVLSLFFWAVINKKIRLNTQPHFTIIITVLMVMGLGLLSYGHISYVTVGTVLLLPLIPNLRVFKFLGLYSFIFIINITLGIVWAFLF